MDRTSDRQEQERLSAIAASLKTAPRKGADSFREALQLSFLAHVVLMIESLDNRWTLYVADAFRRSLDGYVNARGGRYIMGIYSDTIHAYFGQITGATADGRKKGERFSSGIAPGNGCDRNGPTALINSANRFDFTKIPNGINFNLKFYPHTVSDDRGRMVLSSLIKTYFQRGGMQTQINVVDPETLKNARDNPDLHPHLLVRVSGYSVYFNDLTPAHALQPGRGSPARPERPPAKTLTPQWRQRSKGVHLLLGLALGPECVQISR